MKENLPISKNSHVKMLSTLQIEHLKNIESLNIKHTQEIDEVLSKSRNHTEEAIRLAVEKNTNEMYSEFKGQLATIRQAESSTDASDPFYESFRTPYLGKEEKYKEDKLPEKVQESIKYARAKGYLTIYSSPVDREQSDEIREYAQTISYVRAFENPIVGAIPDALQRFVLGRGVKYKFSNREVQDVIDAFWASNNMEMYMKSLVWLLITESEYFPVFFIEPKTGNVTIREIQPAEITGVETNKEDKGTILSYKRVFYNKADGESHELYYPDIKYYENKTKAENNKSEYEGKEGWQGPNTLVQFIKFMKNREVRGRVYLERILRWAEFYNQWILDRAIINHEKGRVVWLLVLKGTRDDVWERFKPAPAGGTVKICTPDREWKPVNADINANDAKEDGLFLLYQVAAGAGIPIHVLTQRTTEQVYSGIRASDSPFSQFILDIQDSLADGMMKPMFRAIIRAAVNSTKKTLPEKVKVKRYVKEFLRDIFRTQLDGYLDGAISPYKMARSVKTLMESAIIDVETSSSMKESPTLYHNVLKRYESLVNSCNSEYEHVLESETYSLDKLFLKEAVDVFEKGTEIEIPTIEIPVEVTFPDMVKEDIKQSAEILKIHRELGIVSKTTASAKAGYNPEQEKYLIKTENFGEEEQGDPFSDDSDPNNPNTKPTKPVIKKKDVKGKEEN